MKQEKWFAVEILADSQTTEAIEFGLDQAGASGTEIDLLGVREPQENTKVVGYFNEQVPDDLLRDQLNHSLEIYGFGGEAVKNVTWREVENQDWLAEWKKHWKPTVTEKFIIAPMWENVVDSEKIVIRIEPSMAFGTGTHETTKLCLQAIEENYRGESFFDVGTGTGILAIAAAKYRSSNAPILGCDTDEDSISIAKENAAVNETPEIDFYIGSINENTPLFEFVCANLTADVIIPILPLLVAKTKKILVLSGILKNQESEVLAELQKLTAASPEIRIDGEWISITVRRL